MPQLTTLSTMQRARDPVRCERYSRNMRALGYVFEIDLAAGTVRTLIDGQPADAVIEAETQRRAWWLLQDARAGALVGASKEELAVLAPDWTG